MGAELSLEASLEDVLEEGLRRLHERGTWKVRRRAAEAGGRRACSGTGGAGAAALSVAAISLRQLGLQRQRAAQPGKCSRRPPPPTPPPLRHTPPPGPGVAV
jgi:hypothetical protein